MKAAGLVPLSVLDLAPVRSGGRIADAFREMTELARHVERLGFTRFWLAEHHNMPGIASAATAVLVGHVAGSTRTIRVGSGGVMLPNHSPLVVAEQFGTLESLYPGRVDLGIGRAPGTDQRTARALRRTFNNPDEDFPRDVAELLSYFAPPREGQAVRAVPGAGLDVPVWILGSSLFGARLAASMGLRFAFASHFAPDMMTRALEIYRAEFRPSAALDKPYAMLGLNAYAAETDEEARRLFTSVQQQFLRLRRGQAGPLPPPVETLEGSWTAAERAGVEHALSCSVVGSHATVRRALKEFVAATRADELMLVAQIYDHAARLRSFEIVADAARDLSAGEGRAA
ncbi:MAG TPA: LLM class flavin-dependent oxidoreductase [Pyrinomonadaceae bacterium]|nr:LLM class flavin-dependent oxidoreductase [Pyrinomonadaceae bacterium]